MQKRRWDEEILTREDIGYGPGRPYEEFGPRLSLPRERRRPPRRERRPALPAAGQGPYAGRLLRRRRPDRWIQAEVEEAIFFDTWVDADRITIDVADGVVTLTGTLADEREAHEAVEDAYQVVGVRGVRNRLEVEA